VNFNERCARTSPQCDFPTLASRAPRRELAIRATLNGDRIVMVDGVGNRVPERTHHAFMRSRRADRVGKTPKQLLTGQAHAHWLELLGFEQSLAGLTSAPTDAPQVLLNPSTIHARPPRLAAPARSPVLPGNGRS
jgi:hypothetical protein